MAERQTPKPVDDWQDVNDWQDVSASPSPRELANRELYRRGISVGPLPAEKPVQASNNPLGVAITRTATSLSNNLNPLEMIKNVGGVRTAYNLGSDVVDAIRNKRMPTMPDYDRATSVAAQQLGVDPQSVKEDVQTGDWGGLVGDTAGPILSVLSLSKATGKLGPKGKVGEAPNTGYSAPADHVAASLKTTSRFDMPAEANLAMPVLKEAAGDLGYTGARFRFSGRRGPQMFKEIVDRAVENTEKRADQVLSPIAQDPVVQKVLNGNPELASRFQPGQRVTYGDIRAELKKMNIELERGGFYDKTPTKQASAGPDLANTNVAAAQARNILYDYAQQRTGVDLTPIRRSEASLLKIKNAAHATKNALSAQMADYNTTGTLVRAGRTAKAALSVAKGPVSAAASGTPAGLLRPTFEFNSNMARAFADVKPGPANLDMGVRGVSPLSPLDPRIGGPNISASQIGDISRARRGPTFNPLGGPNLSRLPIGDISSARAVAVPENPGIGGPNISRLPIGDVSRAVEPKGDLVKRLLNPRGKKKPR